MTSAAAPIDGGDLVGRVGDRRVEAPAPPLDLGLVLGEPGVGRGRAGDRVFQRPPGPRRRPRRRRRRSVLPRPECRGRCSPSRRRALCRLRSARAGGSRRRAANAGRPQRPRKDRRRRCPGLGHSAALRLEPPQRREQRHELVDGVDAPPPARTAAESPCTTRRNIMEPACAVTTCILVGSTTTAPSAVWPRRIVARVPVPPSSSPATLATLSASAKAHAGVPHGLEREERAAEAALHVDRAPSVDPAVPDGRVPRRRRPGRQVAGGHDVDVAVQEQVARRRRCPRQPVRPRARHTTRPPRAPRRDRPRDTSRGDPPARRGRSARHRAQGRPPAARRRPGAVPATRRRRGLGSRSVPGER